MVQIQVALYIRDHVIDVSDKCYQDSRLRFFDQPSFHVTHDVHALQQTLKPVVYRLREAINRGEVL